MGGGSDSKHIVKEHEYCICYSKNINFLQEFFIEHDEEYLKRYSENDEKGSFFWDTFARPGLIKKSEESLIYEIKCPDGSVIKNRWIRSKERFEKEYKEGTIRIVKKNDGQWSVQFKQYLNECGRKPRSMTMDFGGTIEGKNEIIKLFGNDRIFPYPKSTVYIKELIKILTKKDALILDFFSGSATTAHAVMQLNAEDGGNRKFIMVQLPEPCDEKSEAFKAGYKNICEIGKERIRRAGKKILDDSKKDIDVGFRVLKLDSSNMKDTYYYPEQYKQDMLDDLVDNIKQDRTPEDLVFQVMLDMGVLLSSPIEEKEIDGKKIFIINHGDLVCCFDKDLTDEVVTAIAKLQPLYAVFRDSSFSSDSVAVNFEQIFETYSPKTVRKVI